MTLQIYPIERAELVHPLLRHFTEKGVRFVRHDDPADGDRRRLDRFDPLAGKPRQLIFLCMHNFFSRSFLITCACGFAVMGQSVFFRKSAIQMQFFGLISRFVHLYQRIKRLQ